MQPQKKQQHSESFEQDRIKLPWAAYSSFYGHLDLKFIVDDLFQNSEDDLPFSHHLELPPLCQNVLL